MSVTMSTLPHTTISSWSSINNSEKVNGFAVAHEKLKPAAFTGLITPPDSPVDSVVQRDDLKNNPSFHAASGAINSGNAVFPVAQLRAMADVVANARRNGELPPTSSSPMDGNAVVEDYEYLNQLRDARGDFSAPASEAYIQLRIDITRRIKERDELLEEQSNKEEATRRVNSYLRSVQHERNYFEAANTMLQRRGVSQPTQNDLDNISEEIMAVIEHAVEHNMSEATGPLRMNLKRMDDTLHHLHRENTDMRDQNDTYNRQIDLHYRTLEQYTDTFNSHVKALDSMFLAQATNIQSLTTNTHATNEGLAMVSGIVNHLSQIAVNLPSAINQVVYTSMQHQAQAAIQEVMEAQQQVLLEIHEHSQRLSERVSEDSQETGTKGVDVVALATAIAKEMQAAQETSQRELCRSRSKFGKLVRRMFKSGPRHGGKRIDVV